MITIYDALATRLGRTPTHAETIAEVKRILRESADERMTKNPQKYLRKTLKGT